MMPIKYNKPEQASNIYELDLCFPFIIKPPISQTLELNTWKEY